MTFIQPTRTIVRAVRRKDATDEGKSSMQAVYSDLVRRLTEQYQPADLLETEAIHDLAAALAGLKRARRLEQQMFEMAFGPAGLTSARKEFDRLSRYAESLLRQVHRSTMGLVKLQEARRRQEKKAGAAIARAATAVDQN